MIVGRSIRRAAISLPVVESVDVCERSNSLCSCKEGPLVCWFYICLSCVHRTPMWSHMQVTSAQRLTPNPLPGQEPLDKGEMAASEARSRKVKEWYLSRRNTKFDRECNGPSCWLPNSCDRRHGMKVDFLRGSEKMSSFYSALQRYTTPLCLYSSHVASAIPAIP